MKTEEFTSVSPKFSVYREDDGSLSWSPDYDGAPVRDAIPLGTDRCVIRLDPDSSSEQIFRNIICTDRIGNTIWRAELPRNPDAFIDMILNEGTVLARTWSGYAVRIDPTTGRIISHDFVK